VSSLSGPKIFRRSFTIRRFGAEVIVDGNGTTTYEDTTATLNVQPLSADELAALPEGERRIRRFKAFGDFLFTTADQDTGRRGDWLYYVGPIDPEGHWYECVSSLGWDHTPLRHCRSEFVLVPEMETLPAPKGGGA